MINRMRDKNDNRTPGSTDSVVTTAWDAFLRTDMGSGD